MARKRRWKHPNTRDGELYTPMTPQVLFLFEAMKQKHGTWVNVCELTNTKQKVMRDMRCLPGANKRKTISHSKMDQMITGTGVGSLDDFVWFTPEDLIALGLWKDVTYRIGRKSYLLAVEDQGLP